MHNYILSILRAKSLIVFSWGFRNPHPTLINNMRGLRFTVNGLKHQGDVCVLYNAGSDYFEVRLMGKDNSVVREEKDISFDRLVDVIDGLVEKTENYKEDIVNFYEKSGQA